MKEDRDIIVSAKPTENIATIEAVTPSGQTFLNLFRKEDTTNVLKFDEINDFLKKMKEANIRFSFSV
jgi:hypothetical protein